MVNLYVYYFVFNLQFKELFLAETIESSGTLLSEVE